MTNYVADSISSTVDNATVKTQKMVDDFKKTDAGKKVTRSTNAALGSVYSFLDSLLSRGEELVNHYLPPVEPQPQSGEDRSETTAASPSSCQGASVSPLSRAVALGSTVASRLYYRGNYQITKCGSCVTMYWQKVYASVMGFFSAYLESLKSMVGYVKDTFPALQIAEEDVLALRNKASEWWVAFIDRLQKAFSENKEAAQDSMKKGQDTVHQYTTQAKETAAKYSAQAKDAANKYSTDVKEKAAKAKETATKYAADAKDTASKYAVDAKETATKYATDAKETAGKYAADAKATADKYYQTAADKVHTYSQ
ncbi:hypothetical protein FOL47_010976 [Perkinsus chesapeaki]|uniref:Uncharacterized protein n=1 Tax=Perkinsus chesapeaki TaxID=330153 RepID=A0A7J6MPI0_PERCH|nr:hypothetical protein FOL47_010976 [Perkinsus chesapeaki]